MSTIQHHLPDHPDGHSHDPVMSGADWAEDIAVGVMLFSAVAILAVIVVLLLIL